MPKIIKLYKEKDLYLNSNVHAYLKDYIPEYNLLGVRRGSNGIRYYTVDSILGYPNPKLAYRFSESSVQLILNNETFKQIFPEAEAITV